MTLKLVITALFIALSVNAASAGFTPKKREEIPPAATYSSFADITDENLRTIPGFGDWRGEFSEKKHPLGNEAVFYQVVREPLQGLTYFLVHGPKGGALWSLRSSEGKDPLHGERLVLATPTGMKHLVMLCAHGGKSYEIAHLYARPSSFPVFSKRGNTTVDLDEELLRVVGMEDAACREEIRKKMQEAWDGLPDYQKRRRCRFCLPNGTFDFGDHYL